jgi:phosphoribosylanthranilate isomerase
MELRSHTVSAMPLLARFLDPSHVSLKVCGVTLASDADALVELGVDAVGVNFWPGSKRYLAPESAGWLQALAGKILRVGVFVNEPPALPLRLIREGLIDVVQLHGDESPADAAIFREHGIPFIKAIGVKSAADLDTADNFGASAILLDAHAPGIYGGTGQTMDWNTALAFRNSHPQLPIILAGGIVPENAASAASTVKPAALDTASGVESAPGIKDRHKIKALLAALGR